MFDRIEAFLTGIYTLSRERPKLILALSFFVFILLSMASTKLKISTTLDDHLDPRLDSFQNNTIKETHFGNQSTIFLNFEQSTDSSSDCEVNKSISQLVLNSSQISGYLSSYHLVRADLIDKKLLYNPEYIHPCEHSAREVMSPWRGYFGNKTGTSSLFIFDFETSLGSEIFYKELSELMAKNQEIDFQIVGVPIQEYFTRKGMEFSVFQNLIAILSIALLFRFFIGTWKSSFIFSILTTINFSLVLGGMGLLGHKLDILGSCLFVIILVASAEDFLFLSYQLEKNKMQKAFSSLLLPSFFTSLTTVLGMGALFFSELDSISNFGLWASVSAVIEWLILFLVLPSLMNVFPSLRHWTSLEKGRMFKLNIKRVFPTSRILAFILLIFYILPFLSFDTSIFGQDPFKTFPAKHNFTKSLNTFQEELGWKSRADLIMSPDVSSSDRKKVYALLENSDVVERILDYQKISKIISRNIFDHGAQELVLKELESNSFLHERFVSTDKWQRADIFLTSTETKKIFELKNSVDLFCRGLKNGECFLSGDIVTFSEVSQELIVTIAESFFYSVLTVLLVLILLIIISGNLRSMLPLILGAFWGPMALLTIIFAFQIEVNFVTCIVLATSVGLTGDNTIQFLLSKRYSLKGSDFNINSLGRVSLVCAITMFFVSLSFASSYFEPPRGLGMLLGGSFLLSIIGDVWITKGLLRE